MVFANGQRVPFPAPTKAGTQAGLSIIVATVLATIVRLRFLLLLLSFTAVTRGNVSLCLCLFISDDPVLSEAHAILIAAVGDTAAFFCEVASVMPQPMNPTGHGASQLKALNIGRKKGTTFLRQP